MARAPRTAVSGARPHRGIFRRRGNGRSAVENAGPAGGQGPEAAEAFQLNFENADVGTVAKAISGDILKADFIVDPRVTGQISLISSRPVPRDKVIPFLESALLALNAVVIKEGGRFQIAPSIDPGGLRNADYHSAGEGFGTTVIAAKNVPAAMIGRLLEGYGSRAGSVKVESGANFVIVQGTTAERGAALDAASIVDVDWLRTRSAAILPLSTSLPETVIAEINRILGAGEGGLGQEIVQMQPIQRLNAVLACLATGKPSTKWLAGPLGSTRPITARSAESL